MEEEIESLRQQNAIWVADSAREDGWFVVKHFEAMCTYLFAIGHKKYIKCILSLKDFHMVECGCKSSSSSIYWNLWVIICSAHNIVSENFEVLQKMVLLSKILIIWNAGRQALVWFRNGRRFQAFSLAMYKVQVKDIGMKWGNW